MTPFSKTEIERLALLSALHFSSEELETFALEFARIASFIEQIASANIGEVVLQERCLDWKELREDIPAISLPQNDVLNNCPKVKSGSFCVPKMME